MSEPTPAEMGRRLDLILEMLHRIEDRMTPRTEFEAHARETDRRLQALEGTKSAAHAEIHTKIGSVRTELHTELDRIEDGVKERDRWARDVNARVWIAVAAGVLAVAGSAILAVVGL